MNCQQDQISNQALPNAAACLRQFGWAVIGAVSSIVALAISPAFWALFGAAWLLNWLV